MGELPTGTVTFLFTDIEGSTRLLQTLGDAYAEILSAHRRLLREELARHGGSEFGTEGDALFVAFPTAQGAVAAAVAAQRALAEHPWPEGGTVRVRMGVHTGAPTIVEGDYVGLDVHRVARLCSAGHGGQVVVSEATRDLVDSGLAEVGFKDLGQHRLKGLERPERLFQVVAAGLETDFAALRSLAAPSNLPERPTGFVGREYELAAVRELLVGGAARLVTLTGPGGTGKTRLALQAAADAMREFTDGVCFVALAPVREAGLVASTIAQALGVKPSGERDPLDEVKAHLAGRQLLLVLDNFEQVQAAAPVLGALLAAAPRLKLLVTSRVLLRVYGEWEYPVPPLSRPDPARVQGAEELAGSEAVTLFVQRAQAVSPAFCLTDENAVAVAEICLRLDGLPLAIELAASRLRMLSVTELRARLRQRLRLLVGGAADLPARQQTLRGAIEWSYQLLSGEEQAVFRRLAMFLGGCTLEAAEAVVDPAGQLAIDLFDGVASLADHSLLWREETADGQSRYRMLETIREYAHEQLRATGEAELCHERHARYCLDLAETAREQLDGPDQLLWFHRMETEHDNIRAALEWALNEADSDAEIGLRLAAALGWFCYVHGDVREGRGWLEAALVRGTQASPPVRANALHALGVLMHERSEYARAHELFEEALDLFKLAGDRARIARVLNSLGVIAYHHGDPARATMLFEESIAIRRSLGDETGVANAVGNLALLALQQGALERARALSREAIDLCRRSGNRWGMAISLNHLATVSIEQGDAGGAARLFTEAAQIFRHIDEKGALAECLEGLAGVAVMEDDPRRAARLAGAAEAVREASDVRLDATARSRLEPRLALARDRLGLGAYETARREGSAMTLDQALDYALAPKAALGTA